MFQSQLNNVRCNMNSHAKVQSKKYLCRKQYLPKKNIKAVENKITKIIQVH